MTKTLALVVVGFLAGLSVVWVAPTSWTWVSGRTTDMAAAGETEPAGDRDVLYWQAPMDPSFVSDRPGTSPMGMDLVPVYADAAGDLPPGTVRIDPTFAQNIGVRTEPVERRDISLTIRTVGTLAHNDAPSRAA